MLLYLSVALFVIILGVLVIVVGVTLRRNTRERQEYDAPPRQDLPRRPGQPLQRYAEPEQPPLDAPNADQGLDSPSG